MILVETEYKSRQDKRIDSFYEQVKDLVIFKADPGKKWFSLRTPNGSIVNSILLSELTNGSTVITGDFCPARNGIISNHGYGFEWLSKASDPSYLCEKFGIERDYYSDLAEDYAAYMLNNTDEDLKFEDKSFWSIISNDPPSSYSDFLEIGDAVGLNPYDLYECVSGYNPRDLAMLSAIQRRFSELYSDVKRIMTDGY